MKDKIALAAFAWCDARERAWHGRNAHKTQPEISFKSKAHLFFFYAFSEIAFNSLFHGNLLFLLSVVSFRFALSIPFSGCLFLIFVLFIIATMLKDNFYSLESLPLLLLRKTVAGEGFPCAKVKQKCFFKLPHIWTRKHFQSAEIAGCRWCDCWRCFKDWILIELIKSRKRNATAKHNKRRVSLVFHDFLLLNLFSTRNYFYIILVTRLQPSMMPFHRL